MVPRARASVARYFLVSQNLQEIGDRTRGFGVKKRKPVRYGAFARRRSSQRKLKTEYCISLQDRNGRLHLIARVKRG